MVWKYSRLNVGDRCLKIITSIHEASQKKKSNCSPSVYRSTTGWKLIWTKKKAMISAGVIFQFYTVLSGLKNWTFINIYSVGSIKIISRLSFPFSSAATPPSYLILPGGKTNQRQWCSTFSPKNITLKMTNWAGGFEDNTVRCILPHLLSSYEPSFAKLQLIICPWSQVGTS